MQLNLPHKELIIQGGTVTLKKKIIWVGDLSKTLIELHGVYTVVARKILESMK